MSDANTAAGKVTSEACLTVRASASAPRRHHSINRPNPVAVGTVVWLGSELMFFAAIFAIYFSLRGAAPAQWQSESAILDVPYAIINTIALVLSSVTCQLGVVAAERMRPHRLSWKLKDWGATEWMYLSVGLGTIFILGQVNEYATLVSENLTPVSNAYGSIFYFATGIHGLHVLGGLFAMLFLIARYYAVRKFTLREVTSTVVVSYYWHFVDVVWIFLFFAIYILR